MAITAAFALIEAADDIRGFGAELDAADVLDADERAVRIGAHDVFPNSSTDVRRPLGLDVQLEKLIVRHRLRADPATAA
jgi:hypothetical protein